MRKLLTQIAIVCLTIITMTTPVFSDDLELGDSGERVKKTQEMLAYLGYYEGEIDGEFGAGTEQAVKDYKDDHGEMVTGYLTSENYDGLVNDYNWALSEEEEERNIAEGLYDNSFDTLKYQDIEWFSDVNSVKKIIEEENELESPQIISHFPIQSWVECSSEYEENYGDFSTVKVYNGGFMLRYDFFPVAGNVATLTLSFMYPRESLHDDNKAQFYKATYQFGTNCEKVYNELYEKMTSIYGPGKRYSRYSRYAHHEDPMGRIWEAEDGSFIWLGAYYKMSQNDYDECWIIYSAPNVKNLLEMLQNSLDAEKRAKQQTDKKDTSGL